MDAPKLIPNHFSTPLVGTNEVCIQNAPLRPCVEDNYIQKQSDTKLCLNRDDGTKECITNKETGISSIYYATSITS